MKKILLFCIIIFVLPIFSMDKGVLELFQAIESENIEKIKELVFTFPDLSEINFGKLQNYYKGKNILDFTEQLNNQKIYNIIRWLLYADSNERKFFKAVQEGNIPEIKRLITDKDIHLDMNITNYEDDTALMIAVKNQNYDLVQELLRLGVDINWRNDQNQNALMIAIMKNNPKMVETLLNNTIYPIENIDQRDNEDNTPFLLAMKTHNKEIIEAILPEAPDPFIENKKKETAANFAISPEEKKLLTLAQKRFELFRAIKDSKSIADIGKLITSSDILKNILKNIISFRNPLIVAIMENRFDIVQLLIEKGADVNQKFRFGITPLIIAITEENAEIVKFLLKKGADPNLVLFNPKENINNITPLMVALRSIDIAKMLLAAGANPLLKDSEGKTAFDYAQEEISSEYTSNEKKNHLKEVINFLLISYIQHFTQALNRLRRALQIKL